MANGDIELSIQPQPRSIGEFDVRRALPDPRRQRVGPFIFFDHMGPVDFPPGGGVNVRPHPHIGIATITYLFAGEIMHRDSLGNAQVIEKGAVNWMTAGRGIVHSERTPPALQQSGSHLHGIQAWVALPLDLEEKNPGFDHYPEDTIPTVSAPGARLVVVIGEAYGASSPVLTASKTLYVEVDLQAGASIEVPDNYDEVAVYLVDGEMVIGDDVVRAGTMAVLNSGARTSIKARQDCKCMLLGGATLGGERTLWWNFVSSSKERLTQAKKDWRDRKFDPVPEETEFIPLPDK